MQNFMNLKVWRKSHELTLDVYRSTAKFPREERYGLTDQMRRSSASVAANIAEGCGRTDADFGRFLQMATGSASELQYHLLLSHDLHLLRGEDYERLATQAGEVKRMLIALLTKVRLQTANCKL